MGRISSRVGGWAWSLRAVVRMGEIMRDKETFLPTCQRLGLCKASASSTRGPLMQFQRGSFKMYIQCTFSSVYQPWLFEDAGEFWELFIFKRPERMRNAISGH